MQKPSKYRFMAHVARVVDGDTVDVSVDLGFYITANVRLRLNNLDTPELRSKDLKERRDAQTCKAEMERLVMDKDVVIVTHKTGKYGRWITDIIVEDIDVNETMRNFVKGLE